MHTYYVENKQGNVLRRVLFTCPTLC